MVVWVCAMSFLCMVDDAVFCVLPRLGWHQKDNQKETNHASSAAFPILSRDPSFWKTFAGFRKERWLERMGNQPVECFVAVPIVWASLQRANQPSYPPTSMTPGKVCPLRKPKNKSLTHDPTQIWLHLLWPRTSQPKGLSTFVSPSFGTSVAFCSPAKSDQLLVV